MDIECEECFTCRGTFVFIPEDYIFNEEDFNRLQRLPPQDLARLIVLRGEDDEFSLIDFLAAYCAETEIEVFKNIIAKYRDSLTDLINEM